MARFGSVMTAMVPPFDDNGRVDLEVVADPSGHAGDPSVLP